MIDFSRAYHVGVRVPDLALAMADMGDSLGLQWCSVQEGVQSVWLPEQGSMDVPLTFTYSTRGPLHVELLEGGPGSIWDGRESPGSHHIGVWSDDVAGEVQGLLDAGWTLVMAQREPARGCGAFAYVRPPSGLIVELVSSALAGMFQRWFAGGSLG